ncbi:hypothetical protein AAXE64_07940 [Priestia megaterium]
MSDLIIFLIIAYIILNVFCAIALAGHMDNWLFSNPFSDGIKIKHIASLLILPAFILCASLYLSIIGIYGFIGIVRPFLNIRITKRK